MVCPAIQWYPTDDTHISMPAQRCPHDALASLPAVVNTQRRATATSQVEKPLRFVTPRLPVTHHLIHGQYPMSRASLDYPPHGSSIPFDDSNLVLVLQCVGALVWSFGLVLLVPVVLWCRACGLVPSPCAAVYLFLYLEPSNRLAVARATPGTSQRT